MEQTNSPQSIRSAVGSVAEQLRAERRWLNLLRLVVAGTFLSWVLFFTGLPFTSLLPYDASPSQQSLFLVLGLLGSAAYWLFWQPTLRHETSAEFVRVLFGATLLIRNARQFQGRLSAECGRGKRSDSAFTLVVIRLAGEEPNRETADPQRQLEAGLPAVAVRGIARFGDVVGEGEPGNEVWVLAPRADERGRRAILERMASRLKEGPGSLDVFAGASIGSAVFPVDGHRPNELFVTARQELAPLTSAVEHRAAA